MPRARGDFPARRRLVFAQRETEFKVSGVEEVTRRELFPGGAVV